MQPSPGVSAGVCDPNWQEQASPQENGISESRQFVNQLPSAEEEEEVEIVPQVLLSSSSSSSSVLTGGTKQ